jgi:anti-sigma factor RsiW
MDCIDARTHLVGLLRGRLARPEQDALHAHLSGCERCQSTEATERALDDLLDRELPRRHAPGSLRRRLEGMAQDAATGDVDPLPRRRWRVRPALPAVAAAVALAVVGALAVWRDSSNREARAAVVAEAVGDHLRVLADARGLELVSSESHQVKPWFEGRIDFAPDVPVPEVPELRLRGGGVGYFLDRKAAVVGYTLRRHAVTLLAFPPDGIPLVEGGARVTTTALRGFRVATWRGSGVGYALVSDVGPDDFEALAAAFAGRTTR